MNYEPGPTSDSAPLPERVVTPQRLKYEAEIKVFRARYGDLETVRKNLGFSRRQMCRLLLVDPSAWTRWHSAGGKPPPHVYRALEWFLTLEGKAELHPRIADLYLKERSSTPVHADDRIRAELAEVRRRLDRMRIYLWTTPLGAAAVVAAGFLIFR